MRVLAIDTALGACAAAVLDTEHGKVAHESVPMVRGHAEALMPLIARVMRQADMPFSALDRVVTTVGPGSFTGLRVGISAARGIALAAGKPAFGITTLAAYAAPHLAEDGRASVAVAVDARHDHVYFQAFGPGGRTRTAPRLAEAQAAAAIAARDNARVVGTGAAMLAAAWPASAETAPLIDDREAPDIVWVGRLGVAADETVSPPKPLYLRAPDAQPQDAARLPRR